MAVYCGNSGLHRSLKVNGGNKTFGTHDQCFKKGYGIGFNAPINNIMKFIAEWAGPYKPYIVQKLIHGSGKVPPGYQRALLSQALARGFGVGRAARAKKMSRTYSANKSSKALTRKQKPTLPIKTRS
jgi:hypothetical protein